MERSTITKLGRAPTLATLAALAGLGTVPSAMGQTLIPSNGTVTKPVGSNLGRILQFGTGGGGTATLKITGAGSQLFSGAWTIEGSNPVFFLDPLVTFALQPGSQGQAFDKPSFIRVDGGGTLILGPSSYLLDYRRAGLQIQGGSTLTVGDRDWMSNINSISMAGSGTKLHYTDSLAASFSGIFNVGSAGQSTIDVSSGTRTTGDLTLGGQVQGNSDLRILNSGGLAKSTTVVLNFDSGAYAGRLQLAGSRVRLESSTGIGLGGLQVLSDSQLTIGRSMTVEVGKAMDLQADLLLNGSTGTQLNWVDGIDLNGNSLTIQHLQLKMATGPGQAIAGGGDITLGAGGILTLNGATSSQRVLGTGGLLEGPGTIASLGDASGFNGTIQSGNQSSRGILQTTGNASIAGSFLESVMYSGAGNADLLQVGGVLTGLDKASVNVIYDASTSGGPLVPANGTSRSYTIISAATMPGQSPDELALSLLDPLNNQYSILVLDPSNPNTTASGAKFEWITTAGAAGTGVLRITGAPNPTITTPGSTTTNIGSVNNTQLVSAVNQINQINQRPSQSPDAQYVGATLLLLSPQVLPGAIVTAAVAANPDALPNTTFNGMSQAGRVAKLRLMELRNDGIGTAAAQAHGQDTFDELGNPDDFESRTCALEQLSPAADAVMQSSAVDAGVNGPSPRQGSRLWARGYGFYEDVSGQSYAQGDYSAAMGGMMFGADTVLEGGLLAGAFAGFTPGDLSIQSTLGNTQTSLMGLNFGGYASWTPQDGTSYLQGYAMAGYNSADQSRNIQIPGLIRTATSSANVWGAMIGGEGGLNLKLGEKAVLQPYLSLDYGYYTRNAYDESGAGSLNLSVSSQDANLLQPMGGARIMQSFQLGNDRLTPYLGAAFVAQVPLGSWSESATNGFSGAQVFTYGEGADDQYGASFEAGLEFATSNRWTAYLSFNGMAMTDTTVYGGQIGINIPF